MATLKQIHARVPVDMIGGNRPLCGTPDVPGTTTMDPVPFIQQWAGSEGMPVNGSCRCAGCWSILDFEAASWNEATNGRP